MEKVNRCGYFTGKTTPPGCKKMITDYDQRIAELEQQATLDMNRIKQLRIRQLELEEQVAELTQDRDAAYNAGLARAAEIAETDTFAPPYGIRLAKTIRAEINTSKP